MSKPGYKHTDLGLFPDDWEIKPLKQISPRVQVGLVINPSSYYENEGVIPMLTARNIRPRQISIDGTNKISLKSNEQLHSTQVHTNDLVVVRVGYPGTTAVVPSSLDGVNCASMVIIRRGKYDSEFLCYCFNSNFGRNQVELASYGSAQRCFNISSANNFLFPFPLLPEQHAIAKTLGAIDELISGLQELLLKKRDIKRAAQHALLTKTKRLPGFKEEWKETALCDFVRLSTKKINPQNALRSYKCIEMEHVSQETGMLISHTESMFQISIKTVVEPGDILFGKLRPYLRKYYLSESDAVCSTEFWVMKPLENSLSGYIFQLVQSERFIDSANQTTGTKMPRANWVDIKDTTYYLPQLNEQRAIANTLGDMDAEIAALAQQLDKTEALKQGMMQDLLTGTIRLTKAVSTSTV